MILIFLIACGCFFAFNHRVQSLFASSTIPKETARSNDSSYVIQASADANGSIVPGGMVNVDLGKSQSFVIKPNPGYRIDSVVIDNELYDPFRSPLISNKKETVPPSRKEPLNYRFENVHVNHSITVTFVPDQGTYSITVTSDKGGIIAGVNSERPNIIIDQPDPSDCEKSATQQVAAAFHESRHFAIIPAKDYDVDSIIVDGVKFERRPNELGLDQYVWPIYSFVDIESDHVLRATFVKIKQ